MSPTESAFAAVKSFAPMNVPAVDASHNEIHETVSAFATLDHKRSASVVIDCADAAANDACCRVVVAAGFDVPAVPGSPRCNLTHTAAKENAVALPIASRIELRAPFESPAGIYLFHPRARENYYVVNRPGDESVHRTKSIAAENTRHLCTSARRSRSASATVLRHGPRYLAAGARRNDARCLPLHESM